MAVHSGRSCVGVKHGCSSLLHRHVGEERQERQELCSEEWSRAAAAPSLPPHTPTAPSSPRPLPCSQHREETAQQWLSPSAAAAVGRHSSPGSPSWQGLFPQRQAGCLVIADGRGPKYPAPAGLAVGGACTGQAWRSLPASAGLGFSKNSFVCMECSFSGEQSSLQTSCFPIMTPAQKMK